MSDKIIGIEEGRQRVHSKRKISRGDALRRIVGAATVLTTTGGVAISEWGRNRDKSGQTLGAPGPVEVPKLPKAESHEQIRTKTLNGILALKLDDPERKRKEQEYVSHNQTLDDIDLGLAVIVDRGARQKLLEARWKMRTAGQIELKPLTADDLNWANKNKIHPEVLALCLDNYNTMLHTMILYQNRGVYSKAVQAEEMVISPHGMAMMAQIESNGFINIGRYPAINELNTQDHRDEYSSFVELISTLNQGGNLKYVLDNIPGSENPQLLQSSGGALGPMQIMPSSALGIGRELGQTFFPAPPTDPFNIKWALLASSILLAEKGFNATDKAKMEKSLLLWNNDRTQAEKVMKADFEYRRSRIRRR